MLIENKKETLEVRRKMSKRKLILKDSEENLETDQKARGSAKTRKVVVLQNLPKFRQKGYSEEPVEFLESFEKILVVHEISMEKYNKLIPLCLNSIDGK